MDHAPAPKPLAALDAFFLLDAGRLPGLDGLRGLAIVMVFNVHFFAQHFERNYFLDPGAPAHQLLRALHSGVLGVDVLFVLSGFLTWVSLARRRPSVPAFLAARYRRLLPVILAVNLPALCWGAASVDWRQALANVFFLHVPPGVTLVTYTTWALVYEMWFYLLCAAWVLVLGRFALFRSWGFFWLLAAALAANILVFKRFLLLGDPRFLGFLFGVALARAWGEGRIGPGLQRAARLGFVPALAALLAFCWAGGHPHVEAWMARDNLHRLAFFLALDATICLILLRLILPGPGPSAFTARPLRMAGMVSYSLFMTHTQWGLPLANRLAGPAADALGMALRWGLSLGLCLLLAALIFAVFERPYFSRP
ncbi:hypothetical protein NNJEOMEG_03834 [Fundidesulfovibrio magnetotacticus]|uniref:Acyltransferase 3 domain-containing protein n=1 Tax=Fundidesulfovibrio magnetotacticus TaxID=2730080 RepID=A0A6V8LZI5_9BACT|nr:acyltransferase family protein [Fundidesulfovibrio magnetotacticus]GFK95961.1 hypothetical protein NNJEOMEG_03834 [Fundidesulfovibrio magnetotacticus]